MEWSTIKYLAFITLFISLNTYACLGSFAHRTKADILSGAMDNKSVVVIATIKSKCELSEPSIYTASKNKDGEWVFEEAEKETLCTKDSYTIKINKSFNIPTAKITNVKIGPGGSCDMGPFHPTKPIIENGKVIKKVNHYSVGQKYLLILGGDFSGPIYIRAGQKLDKVGESYIKQYTEYNTAISNST